jgi:hypothetical protein
MKKIFFLLHEMTKALLMGLILFSCQSKAVKEKKHVEENLFTYFKENLKTADSTMHLDSVRVLKFDTITPSTILYKKIMSIYDEIDESQELFDAAQESRNNAKQMLRLTAGLSSALYNNSLEDYNKKNEEMISIHTKDSLLIKEADSLTGILKNTDSTTLVYLQVKCLIQYQRKDLSVGRDTGYAFLNPEKNIVRREDIFK